MVLEHLGKLHPYEAVIVYFLALAPILLLVVTIVIARKRALADEAREQEDGGSTPED